MQDGRWQRQFLGALQLGCCLLAAALCQEANAADLPSVTDIARVLRGLRLVEPRFSGGFDYAPCVLLEEKGRLIPRAECSPYPEERTASAKGLQGLKHRFEIALPSFQKNRQLHGYAILSALYGVKRDGKIAVRSLSDAIQILDRLRKIHPRNPLLLNDLAATHFLKAVSSDEPADLFQALEWIEQGHTLAPNRTEILFNRALILDRLYLRFLAKNAWKELATVLPGTAWSEYAIQRLAVLNQPSAPEQWQSATPKLELAALGKNYHLVREIVKIDPQIAREYVLEKKLPEWGQDHLAHEKEGANHALWLARTIEELLRDSGRLEMGFGSLTLDEEGTNVESKQAAMAYINLGKGQRDFAQWNMPGSLRALTLSVQQFSTIKSPAEAWARVSLARTEGYLSRFSEARRNATLVTKVCRGTNLQALSGWSHWIRGWSVGRERGFPSALGDFLVARDRFAQANERENRAAMDEIIADGFGSVGQSDVAWRLHFDAIKSLGAFPLSIRRHNALLSAGLLLSRYGHLKASQAMFNDQLIADAASKDRVRQAELHWAKAIVSWKNNESTVARQEITRGFTLARDLPFSQGLERLWLDLTIASGWIESKENSGSAYVAFNSATSFAMSTKSPLILAEALAERGRFENGIGASSAAAKDLCSAISIAERENDSSPSGDLRDSLSEKLATWYDELLEIEPPVFNDREMLGILERSKNWRFPRQKIVGSCKIPIPDLETVYATSSIDSPILVLCILRHKLVGWWITGKTIRRFDRPIQADDLRDLVIRFRNELQANGVTAASRKLGSVLYASLGLNERQNEKYRSLRIVPDRFLTALPFNALWNSALGIPLIAERDFTMVPSLSVILSGVHRAANSRLRAPKTLLVGASEMGQTRESLLQNLPGAASDLRAFERGDGATRSLIGSRATRNRVIVEIQQARDFIFAGHIVSIEGDSTWKSALVLAPQEFGSIPSLLSAREVSRLKLGGLRRVILAACNSVGSRGHRTSGVGGMGGAFLAAGADEVLGTSWAIQDRDSYLVWHEVYSAMKQDISLAEVVRALVLRARKQGFVGKRTALLLSMEVFSNGLAMRSMR